MILRFRFSRHLIGATRIVHLHFRPRFRELSFKHEVLEQVLLRNPRRSHGCVRSVGISFHASPP